LVYPIELDLAGKLRLKDIAGEIKSRVEEFELSEHPNFRIGDSKNNNDEGYQFDELEREFLAGRMALVTVTAWVLRESPELPKTAIIGQVIAIEQDKRAKKKSTEEKRQCLEGDGINEDIRKMAKYIFENSNDSSEKLAAARLYTGLGPTKQDACGTPVAPLRVEELDRKLSQEEIRDIAVKILEDESTGLTPTEMNRKVIEVIIKKTPDDRDMLRHVGSVNGALYDIQRTRPEQIVKINGGLCKHKKFCPKPTSGIGETSVHPTPQEINTKTDTYPDDPHQRVKCRKLITEVYHKMADVLCDSYEATKLPVSPCPLLLYPVVGESFDPKHETPNYEKQNYGTIRHWYHRMNGNLCNSLDGIGVFIPIRDEHRELKHVVPRYDRKTIHNKIDKWISSHKDSELMSGKYGPRTLPGIESGRYKPEEPPKPKSVISYAT
jgi:hypothetical protein